jgi:hypothetical protein
MRFADSETCCATVHCPPLMRNTRESESTRSPGAVRELLATRDASHEGNRAPGTPRVASVQSQARGRVCHAGPFRASALCPVAKLMPRPAQARKTGILTVNEETQKLWTKKMNSHQNMGLTNQMACRASARQPNGCIRGPSPQAICTAFLGCVPKG